MLTTPFVALLACGSADEGIHAEPRTLVFSPAAERLELRLVNDGDVAVPLTRIRFDPRTPDWGAFILEDREHPREIAAHDSVRLRVRIDRDHFKRGGVDRSGESRLLFLAGDTPQVVDVRFAPPDLAGEFRLALVRSALLLALAGLAYFFLRRGRTAPPPWTLWLPPLVVFALLPLGPGLCPSQLGVSLSAADIEQCAAGRGGTPLALTAVGEGWIVYLVVLVLAAIGRLREASAGAVRLAWRDLALALAFAGPLLAFGTLDPRQLVGEQAMGLFGATIPPRWGVLVQPIAAAVAVAVAAALPLTWVERLAFAAAFTAFFLGGHTFPGLGGAGSTHFVALVIGLVVLATKIAAIAWLVQRLHHAPSGSRARAALTWLGRGAVVLVLLELLVTSAYGLSR